MSTSQNTLNSLKQMVPAPLKRAAKEIHWQMKLRGAIEPIAKLPVGEVPTLAMVNALQKAWDNDGFAARMDLLMEVAKRAATTSGPILECGSGLTTILMGLLAGRRGVKVYSLEHFAEWRARIEDCVAKFQISNVQILSAPLREFADFEWYNAPLAELPENFSLVLCDGPPGETRGGRYGLLPVMRDRLAPDAVIILDDTEREGELKVLRRWQNESSFDIAMHDSANGSFAVLSHTVPTVTANESSPRVSIIIPAYNVAPYIGETLESVFAQTFTSYEVIVVNDGSPDTVDFEKAIEPHLDRIVYLKQDNAGASVARNTGLNAARGEFIAFLDADDVWLPNYLEAQMKFIRERDADLVCADAEMFGEPATEGQSYMTLLMNDAPAAGEVSFLELVDAQRSLITSGILARRDRISETGLFDPALRTAQDFDMWLRLALNRARLSYHRRTLLKYRCRPDGLTRDEINSHQRELRIFDKIQSNYDLSSVSREEVERIINDRRALLQFELGKLYAAREEFEKARDSFAESQRLKPATKKSLAIWLLQLAPNLMRSICKRRV